MAKFGEEEVDRCQPNFNDLEQTWGYRICRRNRIDVVCRFSTMDERDRQTDPRKGNIDINKAKSIFSDVAPKPKNICNRQNCWAIYYHKRAYFKSNQIY